MTLKNANLALKFFLELAAIAAFAYWGSTIGSGSTAVLAALAGAVAAIALWGLFAAPRAKLRLPLRARVPFELTVFGVAAAALYTAAGRDSAAAFSLAVIVNSVLLTFFRQWEN